MTAGVRSGWIGNCIGSLYHQPTKMEQMMKPTMERLLAIMEEFETTISDDIAG
jgi:hypothetical protein